MKKKYKFDKSSLVDNIALLHMVGQGEDMRLEVGVSQIAAWMNVSKPTAKKYMEKLVKDGHVVKHMSDYRPNIKKVTYMLSEYDREIYEQEKYYRYYMSYANKVIKS